MHGLNVRAIVEARSSERVRASPKGWVGLYLDFFKEGLCIPVSPRSNKIL